MPDSSGIERRRGNVSRSYSLAFQVALSLCALAIAFLPIPVTLFQLLPSYQAHAWFLVFYTPVVCLLILGYLFYIRDLLARAMFSRLMRRPSEYEIFYRRPGMAVRAGRALVAVLPVLLLLTSFYCVSRYTSRLTESVTLATGPEELGLAPPNPDAARDVGRAALAPRQRSAADSASGAVAPRTAREQVLRSTGIDGIPFFTELTVLYIGAFAAALVAAFLMALKEYAKNAMGLTEGDLMRGRDRGGRRLRPIARGTHGSAGSRPAAGRREAAARSGVLVGTEGVSSQMRISGSAKSRSGTTTHPSPTLTISVRPSSRANRPRP